MDREIQILMFAVSLFALQEPSSFWEKIEANPAATLGVVGALVAALVTLITFMFNFRATVRNQQDTQFYEALKRFGDQTSPVLRSSAAGLLAQMAARKTLFRRRHFSTTLDQLTTGLRIETDPIVLESVGKAISQLARLQPYTVIEELRAVNLKLQEDVVTLLARAFALQGAKEMEDCESICDSAALLPPFAAEEVKILIRVIGNRETFANSLHDASGRYQSLSDEKRIEKTNEVTDLLRLEGRRLRDNRGHMESALSSVLPPLPPPGFTPTKTGFKTTRKIPLLKRYRRRGLSLDGMFLPRFSLEGRFISKVSFQRTVLMGAHFKDSVVRDTVFEDAYLRGADFSGALLKSQKFGPPLPWGTVHRTSFARAQLWGVDFREAEFFEVVMHTADMTGAKMYGASIVVDEYLFWDEANWWRADYDQGDYARFYQEALDVITNDSLKLLYRRRGWDLPSDPNAVHPSIREFVAASRREEASEVALAPIPTNAGGGDVDQ